MRVFLDTNVLASAIGTRGLCREIVEAVLEAHEIVISPALLTELERVLEAKFRLPQGLIDEWRDYLLKESTSYSASAPLPLALEDAGDLTLLSDAAAAQVDVFVTGDRKIIEIVQIGTMEIVSPRGFWERFNPRRATPTGPSASKTGK